MAKEIKGVIRQGEELYVAIDMLLGVFEMMAMIRDRVIAEGKADPSVQEGSNAALVFLTNALLSAKKDFYEHDDLSEETTKLIEGIEGMLDEQ